jgi:DNA modification methylase
MTQPNRMPLPGLKPKDLVGIPWRVAFALQADGWWLRSDIIWHKPNPMPESVTDRPTKAHEYVFLLTKGERYQYDADAIAEKATQPTGAPRLTAQHKRGVLQDLTASTLGSNQGAETRNARSVWTVATQPFSGAHFATMPPELVRRCILAGSRPGDTVLDPFNGAGTTGLVAQEHGREYVGIELNEEYIAISERRLAQTTLGVA